jgi:hypothetical protein
VSGIAHALVALCELRPDTGGDVKAALAALDRQKSPFARVTGTHFARWAYIGRPPGPTGESVANGPEYLLMCADHDPALPVWAHALCAQGGAAVESVMQHCVGWPGVGAPGAVAEFLAARNARPGFTINTYRRVTVPEVSTALSLRRSLRALAVAAPGLSPQQLRERWPKVGSR